MLGEKSDGACDYIPPKVSQLSVGAAKRTIVTEHGQRSPQVAIGRTTKAHSHKQPCSRLEVSDLQGPSTHLLVAASPLRTANSRLSIRNPGFAHSS